MRASEHRVRDYTGEYVILDSWDADAFARETDLAPLDGAEARSRVTQWGRDPRLGPLLRRVVLQWNERGAFQPEAAARALEDAFRMKWKVFKLPRTERQAVKLYTAPSNEAVLGPEPVNDAEPDIFVLAAEVKLLGDTPLINHAVRILDPDTGAVVADATTDDKGIVRAEVPENKKYRIEFDDHQPDLHEWPTVVTPHPMLRCVFVDLAGARVPQLDVTVKDLEGHSVDLEADEDGLLELPMPLGLYEVIAEGESHWVHSLLHTDGDGDAYEIVVTHELEDGGDGLDPDERLTRHWEHAEEADEDDDGALA
jgi:hypothetical protein